ncbi:MAG: aldehyde dehydrogenase family protein [Dehalococcoidia bacterium]|nr:aldehyde dehydrogenase family protein [Dehalococcoidia bacterium]
MESPDVDMVAFTGSKNTGVWIYEHASKVQLTKGGVKRVVSEMGGKNAIVVFPDADPDEVVRAVLTSSFGHANQKCSACSRVFIHSDIYDRIKQRLIDGARSLPVGVAEDRGTFINPVISESAKDEILRYAEKARSEGRVLLDNTQGPYPSPWCIGPLIVELDPSQLAAASIASEEIFGPILTITPFDDDEQVISMVNSTSYALTAGIFSRSPSTVKNMAAAIKAGNIYVNRDITGARPGIEPFGGFRLSGTGPKAGGGDYLSAFVTRKDKGERRHRRLNSGDGHQTPPNVDMPRPWDVVPPAVRLACLREAVSRLAEENGYRLREAIGVREAAAETQIERLISTLNKVLDTVSEIDRPQPTLEVPGQKNFTSWETPRGIGIVAANDATEPAMFAGMVFGALLAGNGVLVASSPGCQPLCDLLIDNLYSAGVPKEVLASVSFEAGGARGTSSRRTAASGGSIGLLTDLAERPFNFALVDLDESDTRSIYSVMGITLESQGQNWFKALISLDEGPRLGEAGFLRLLALPKTMAIRTLRHGADLELV